MPVSLPSFLCGADDPPAKRAILASALRRFVVDGVEGTSIRAVADEAGFTNPALFRHFESKEALAVHLFAVCYRHLAESVIAVPPAPFSLRFEAVVRRYLQAYDESPEAVLYVQDHLRRFWPAMPEEIRRLSLLGAMQSLLRAGVDEGAVAADLDVSVGAGAVIGVLAQLARMLYFDEFASSAEAMAPHIVALTRRMLAPALPLKGGLQ
jgi:AcrR family transcriptional regulator